MTVTAEARPTLKARVIRELIDWAKFLAWAIPAWLVITTVAYANYRIPSESMVPALEVGDRVIVSKWSYGYSRHSLPLNLGGLFEKSSTRLFGAVPRRGDVVVFIHPAETGPDRNKVMIKRLIGMPGDEIAVLEGVLYINGVEASQSESQTLVRAQRPSNSLEEATRITEALPEGYSHPIHQIPNLGGPRVGYGPYVVPEGYFFMMGDNRDNSADSRSEMGPVPLENLIGRAETVYFVTRWCDRSAGIACPQPRLFRPLSPKG